MGCCWSIILKVSKFFCPVSVQKGDPGYPGRSFAIRYEWHGKCRHFIHLETPVPRLRLKVTCFHESMELWVLDSFSWWPHPVCCGSETGQPKPVWLGVPSTIWKHFPIIILCVKEMWELKPWLPWACISEAYRVHVAPKPVSCQAIIPAFPRTLLESRHGYERLLAQPRTG